MIFLYFGMEHENKLNEFIKQINTLHPTIKFEANNYSFNSINFLDTHIYKNKDGKLCYHTPCEANRPAIIPTP